jgi:molybdopterin molybdotransferase
VALFSTGDELVMPGEPAAGAIYNSNRYVLRGLLEALGCQVCDLGIVPDSLEATRAALRAAAGSNDLIITSGGVSVGEEDHVKPAVQAEGQLDLWLVAMKPGKPVAFGRVNDPAGGRRLHRPHRRPVNLVSLPLLVRPFVLRADGRRGLPAQGHPLPPASTGRGPTAAASSCARGSPRRQVELFPNQGPGVLSSTVWAAGLVDNPAGHAIAAGEPVSFIPYSELLS